MNTLSALGLRLRSVRESLGVSQRGMADRLGITHSTYSTWELGKTGPSALALMALCAEGIDARWLLTGRGAMYAGPPQDTATSPPTEPGSNRQSGGLQDALAQESRRAEGLLDLGEISSLARLSAAGRAWRVMEALLAAHPSGLAPDQLAVATGFPATEVTANLTLLLRLGAVTESAEGRFCLPQDRPAETLPTTNLPERQFVTLQAATAILREVGPSLERGAGHLALMRGRIAKDTGPGLMKALSTTLADMVKRTGEAPGEEEGMTIILAVALESTPD